LGKIVRLIPFTLGGEVFDVDIMAVRQIVPYEGATPVPGAPSFIEGIIVYRNEVVPLIDLARRLVPTAGNAPAAPLVLVATTESGTVAFKVDDVRRIVTADTDSFLPAPDLVKGIRGDYLVGVLPQGDDLHLLLDVENVLTADEKEELRGSNLQK
jgi:purine-binding chemotaxis protein CheW